MTAFTFIRSTLLAAVFALLFFASAPLRELTSHAQRNQLRSLECSASSPLWYTKALTSQRTPRNRSSESVKASNEAFAAIPAASTFADGIYYTIRRDVRRCAFPMCGGYFVRRVNHPLTRCWDGKFGNECYVADIDWNGNAKIEAQAVLLAGRMVSSRGNKGGKFSLLSVTESWQAASNQMPKGIFYLAKDRGLRCVTHPCLTHYEAQLNSPAKRNVAGVDLSGAGAPEDKVAEAFQAMTGADGVIVAGSHVPVTGPAGRSQSLKATQFYLRAGKQVGLPRKKSCMRTGCSRQVCADAEVITTCEWRPEYACYQRARCERQADGNCGFTMTPQLRACLAGSSTR